jgi:phosphatidylglycerophosphate synthase
MMLHPTWLPPPDGSRDPRIEDPTNRWIVHLAGRALLPATLRAGISANSVSLAGLLFGAGGAWAFYHWREPWLATLGLLLCTLWMIADGLDGMVARATRTTSQVGRILDGICDHGVFVLVYVALAASLHSPAAWVLASAAGAAHAVQASLYEAERNRFHQRLAGQRPAAPVRSRNPLVRLYDAVAATLDRVAAPFDSVLAAAVDKPRLIEKYAASSTPALRAMAFLTNNMRVLLIWLACIAGNPGIFWWIELGPLTVLAAAGLWSLRRAETRLLE